MRRIDAHVAKARGARGTQSLAETAPVVDALHARRFRWHQRDHAVVAAVVVVALRRDRDPFGIEEGKPG